MFGIIAVIEVEYVEEYLSVLILADEHVAGFQVPVDDLLFLECD